MLNTLVGLGAGATPVIGEAVDAAITSGLLESKSMIVGVIGLTFAGIVGIIVISGGANFALRKIRSVFGWA